MNQTFSDIEIICINDCSPDGSSKILDEYVKRDSRIKVINHEKNKGLGGARNTGVEAATGDYSWFIDSDDMIALDACELLSSIINNTQAQIIRFNSLSFYDDATNRLGRYNGIDKCYWPYNEIITKNAHTRLKITEVTAWSYITHTSHLKKFKFRENAFHEDIDFTQILFSEAESIYCINSALYFRRLHNQSITGGAISKNKLLVDKLLAVDALYNYIASIKLERTHFIVRGLHNGIKDLKKEYNTYPEIHNEKFKLLISDIEKSKPVFYGDTNLYNDIIKNYGNTKLLEFILKVYRYWNRLKNAF